MKNFSIVYKESIKKLLRSKMVYGSLIVSLMVTGFVLVFIPLVLSQFDISNYYDSTSYIQTGMQGTFAVFGLVAAVVGETNALSSEKIYFLSKPLKRTTFL
jgi:ABC-type transport system involved in multi-copper enzyme maturation permease subunit